MVTNYCTVFTGFFFSLFNRHRIFFAALVSTKIFILDTTVIVLTELVLIMRLMVKFAFFFRYEVVGELKAAFMAKDVDIVRLE